MRLQPGATQLGWCTLGVTLLEGDSFTNGGRVLMIAAGQVDNTGMQWKDASKTSVGSKWGGAPVLAEVPFNLTLAVEPGRLKVSALNELGQRLGELAVAVTNGRASVNVATNAGTLWYELLIAKDTAFRWPPWTRISRTSLACQSGICWLLSRLVLAQAARGVDQRVVLGSPPSGRPYGATAAM